MITRWKETMIAIAVLAFAAGIGLAAAAPDADLERLASWLAGSYGSAAQAAADEDYADIRLHMVRIWKDRADGPWLYVEQALASKTEAPYRQRIYRLVRREDGALESRVFTLPEPIRFAGAWKSKDLLAGLKPENLTAREGCTTVLRLGKDGAFTGGTEGKACPSDLRGATYATSEVVLTEKRMVSWDRGFDAEGKQVWGAVKGGYEFIKEEEKP